MHIEFLVEEESAEAALIALVPKILDEQSEFDTRVFQGKPDLLKQLPARLRGYRSWLPPDRCIVILLDSDGSDCSILKQTVIDIVQKSGLTCRSDVNVGDYFQVLCRIAIEELESWFFGDIEAIAQAYPGFNRNLAKRSGFRDPDGIKGGTWEALLRELQRAGYHQGLKNLPKIETAFTIAEHMQPDRNRSHSFQVFRDGLRELAQYIRELQSP